MSWTRCRSCGSFLDAARFRRCCVCGGALATPEKELEADPVAPGTAVARRGSFTSPPGERPEVEMQAEQDHNYTNGATAAGIVMGVFSLVMYTANQGVGKELVGLGFLALLAIVWVLGKNWEGESPGAATVVKVAGSALATIGIILAALALLAAAVIALIWVICLGTRSPF